MSVLPHLSRLFADYLALGEQPSESPLHSWYAAAPLGTDWMNSGSPVAALGPLADALESQGLVFGASPETLANIARLRAGARAVVTGQQVGLLGGPLLTLLKAATAVARASEASSATGVPHVPVFWLATEDHDLAEVDQVAIPAKRTLETLRLSLAGTGGEVGSVPLGPAIDPLLDRAFELLSWAPVTDLLRQCYTPETTLGGAFARLLTRLFAAHGLIVMDASTRPFHSLGAPLLRSAIERAGELEAALLDRTRELEDLGYHAQVLVKPGASLLFLIDESTGERLALRRTGEGAWKAGPRSYATTDLLAILDASPERLSPNALLRPLFQDTLLPTAAYIGGPAEIAYFAQSQVLYGALLGRLTPVLPRLSATLIEPATAALMSSHEVSLEDVLGASTTDALTLRLAARAMPIEGKRRLAAAGNALDDELTALTGYMSAMDESLGRSAGVSASKMRYQMNRLRRMAANFEAQKEASLRRHAEALTLHLFPGSHPQERVIGGAWFLAQAGDVSSLIDRLVAEAHSMCLGHSILRL